MTRPLRIQFPNAHYHVTCRGNARQEIYEDDRDRLQFLKLLSRSAEIYQVEVLAYVLMSNHFHLLLKTPLANLQEFMRHFNISYTSHFNRAHGRAGHLYQGRYQSFLIEADAYLQEVSRYIHLNPLRRKETAKWPPPEKRAHLRRYRWSSYPTYISPRPTRSFLQTRDILGHFGDDAPEARRQYRVFVEEGLAKEVGNPLEKGRGHGIVGSADFLGRIREQFLSPPFRAREVPSVKRLIGQVEPQRILEAVASSFQVSQEDLRQSRFPGMARAVSMELLYRYGGLNQREIGEWMRVDYSAVSVARKRLQDGWSKDRTLLKQVEGIKRQLLEEHRCDRLVIPPTASPISPPTKQGSRRPPGRVNPT